MKPLLINFLSELMFTDSSWETERYKKETGVRLQASDSMFKV
jgi:hypothetical protein